MEHRHLPPTLDPPPLDNETWGRANPSRDPRVGDLWLTGYDADVFGHLCPAQLATENPLVEVDGDVAWAEFYGRAYHRVPAGEDGLERDLAVNTRWIDRFERRNGEWRIARRKVVVDTDRVDPVTERWVPLEQYRGRRDRSDPSYDR